MARFRYRAVDPSGEVVEAEMEAPDRASVIRRLQEENHLPIQAEPLGPGAAAPRRAEAGLFGPALAALAALFGEDAPLRFVQSLARLLAAGLPLDRALVIMTEVAGGAREAMLAASVLDEIKDGHSLSTAMARQGAAFDRFAVALVQAGEAGGRLAEGLERLADHQRRARRIRESVRTALIYPAFLLAVAAISIAILLVVVIPEFEALFDEAARELPLLTRIVFGAAAAARDFGWLLLLLFLLWLLWFRRRLATPEGRRAFDRRLLGLPLAGRLIRDLETERFARSLAALLGGGVALPEAMRLAGEAMANRELGLRIVAAGERLAEGARLSQVLAQAGALPALALQLTRVGEETGRLPDMLQELAGIYAEEAESGVRRAMALIEPVLIVSLGLFVALVIVSVMVAVVGLNALAL
ncbi:MAG: type II secretion system F family protein [Alphaproteobacteria bacterium]|nr:type II secretion system F family protein [Alphaproteobacteria bacterium]